MKCLGALAENTLKKPYTRLCWRGISSTATVIVMTVVNFGKVNWKEEKYLARLTWCTEHWRQPAHFSTHWILFDDAEIRKHMWKTNLTWPGRRVINMVEDSATSQHSIMMYISEKLSSTSSLFAGLLSNHPSISWNNWCIALYRRGYPKIWASSSYTEESLNDLSFCLCR